MTRGSLLGRDHSGLQFALAWTVCGGMECTVQKLVVHCVLKQSSDIVASPGTMLAPALSTDREQQQQHILKPASAKDALAQHHARHCSVCEAARHTHQGSTHIRAHTRTHTQTHAHAHIHTHAHIQIQMCTKSYIRTQAHAQTQTHARAQIQTPKHTGTHTCICMHMLRVYRTDFISPRKNIVFCPAG